MIKVVDLEKIENPKFLKNLSKNEKKNLSIQIREFLMENISKTGGHLASNLGVVELTIAIHSCFNLPKDKLIFDVSHQTYVHKILTGRAKDFKNLRKIDGLSGYSSRKESVYDFYETGHSSTSMSAQSGIIKALNDDNDNSYVISVVGDAALGNGMCFEALNYIGEQKNKNCIIILNDNKMGISQNVGALNKFLNKFRKTKFFFRFKSFIQFVSPEFLIKIFKKVKRGLKGFIQKSNIFEDLGFSYIGPVDGHNIEYLMKNINLAKSYQKPVLLHVITTKGKGYKDAELDCDGDFHGVNAKFNEKHCEALKTCGCSYSLKVSQSLENYMERHKDLYIISSAMIKGSMLNNFQKKYPNHLIDVGIAEEHAATMASGLAIMNKKVYLSYYSTFSQRAYDQINHDIIRQNLKCVIGLDRSGIVGEDGQTHQGIYDLSIFSPLDCEIVNPYDDKDIEELIEYSFSNYCTKTIFVRYPRGTVKENTEKNNLDRITKPSWKYFDLNSNSKICFISYGLNLEVFQNVKKNLNVDIDIVNALFIKPLDFSFLDNLFKKYDFIFSLEEVIFSGSLANSIVNYCFKNRKMSDLNKFYSKTLESNVVEFGDITAIKERLGLDWVSVCNWVQKIINK